MSQKGTVQTFQSLIICHPFENDTVSCFLFDKNGIVF